MVRVHLSLAVLALTLCPSSAKHKCWDSVFTAERCCDTSASHLDTGCWGKVDAGEQVFSFEACCDNASIAYASLIRRRWDLLVSARATGGYATQSPQLIGGCSLDETTAPTHFLHNFRIDSFKWDSRIRQVAEAAATLHNRLRWRQGSLHRGRDMHPDKLAADRCGSRPEEGGVRPEERKTAGSRATPLVVWMWERFRRAGLALDGWIVNIGAGFRQDPMHELARHATNMSAIFIDPLGLRGLELPRAGVHFVQEAADPGNFCEVLAKGGLACGQPGARNARVDFLKIDIDSFDCAMARAALVEARPKAVWIEMNIGFPPPLRFMRQWDPRVFPALAPHMEAGRYPATMGCSISAAVALFGEAGYGLYGTDGLDAVFVREEFGKFVDDLGVDEFLCYQEIVTTSSAISFVSSDLILDWWHSPPQHTLRRAWCNLTVHDFLLGLDGMPFTLSF